MSVATALDIKRKIYVRLLDEGTEVYRPISCSYCGGGTYRIEGAIGNLDVDEKWEFPIGSLVKCKEKVLDGDVVSLAFELLQEE
jgi:hypothetical protein